MRTTAVVLTSIVLLLGSIVYAQQPQPTRELTAQVPSPQTPQTTVAAGVLDQLVEEALQHNPGVQSALHTYRAKLHRVPQAKALPDPKVGVGWIGGIEPFDVQNGFPPSNRNIQASEQFPFPGKLGLRGDMASKEAQAAWWDYEAQRRRVTADVKTAYYQYFFFDKAVQITEKNKDLLEKLSRIAEARYRVGKGIQQDVLKAQTELSLLISRLSVLRQNRDTAQARINTLLSRSPETQLPPPAEVRPAVLSYGLNELYQLAATNDPGLQREQQMVERNQYAVNLARKEYLPDFSVGYMYQQRPMLRDSHGFTVTVNIPIFYKSKQREAEKQAAEEMIAARQAKDSRHDEVNFGVKQEYLAAQASADLVRLYSQAVVPQASLALESSMSSYQVGTVDFLTVLANFSNVLDYQIDYYRELTAFQTALARLEPLVGVELTTNRAQNPLVPPQSK